MRLAERAAIVDTRDAIPIILELLHTVQRTDPALAPLLKAHLAGLEVWLQYLDTLLRNHLTPTDVISEWYLFLPSIDTDRDRCVLTEIHLWQLYHPDDSRVHVVVPGLARTEDRDVHRVFRVRGRPALVLTHAAFPAWFVRFDPGFISTAILGSDWRRLRRLMGDLHAVLEDYDGSRKWMLHGSVLLARVKLAAPLILSTTWNEIKEFVKIGRLTAPAPK
jgi:hypothetical protein